jgi:hypothetical protein
MRVLRRLCAAFVLVALGPTVQSVAAATLTVNAGDNLQTALNAAQPGDVVMLAAGATFVGNFILPAKTGTGVITVRSAAADSVLPPAGQRITPAFASKLPKIQSTNSGAALATAAGAHNWRLLCLEFPSTLLGYGEIVRIGEGGVPQTALSQVPHDIEVDRVYVHGSPVYGQKRGIALNGKNVTIHNSHISDIKAVGFDAQAIAGWNGPGPFTIENNYLEAAGENFLLGGSDPSIAGLITEYVVFRYNLVSKPVSWQWAIIPPPGTVSAAVSGGGTLPAGSYAYKVVARRQVGGGTWGASASSIAATATVGNGSAVKISWSAVADASEYRVYGRNQYWTVTGTTLTDTGAAGTAGTAPTGTGDTWQVKNLFELKNARHVTVEFNIFENNWANAQKGYSILFTPRNQDGGCPWCVVEDVAFQFNEVRNVAAGVNVLGYDSPNPSAQTNNIRIRHNLFHDLALALGGNGWFMLIGDAPRDIIVEHNTVDFEGTTAVYAYGGTATAPRTITGFQFINNAVRHNDYGINGASSSSGNTALAAYFPGAVVTGNWLQGGSASRYPAGNFFTGTFDEAFLDVPHHDYRVSAGSVLIRHATDGTNIGADIATLTNGIKQAGTSTSNPGPNRPLGLRILQ